MSEVATIDRFPDYLFRADGSVVSLTRKEPFVMSPIRAGQYKALTLRRADGALERVYLHRAIAEAFHGPCPDGMQCCHLDGDKSNNSAGNLRWDTPSANNRHKDMHGTSPRGARNPMAKLTPEAVEAMRAARDETGKSYAGIAQDFNVSTMTAFRAISGQSWSNQ